MIRPKAIRYVVGVCTLSFKPSIVRVTGVRALLAAWAALAISSLCNAASGTPTKLTKSLPAKAKARENVPDIIIRRRTLKLLVQIKNEKKKLQTKKVVSIIGIVLTSNHASSSGVMKEAPLAPLITKKYRIAVMQNPP